MKQSFTITMIQIRKNKFLLRHFDTWLHAKFETCRSRLRKDICKKRPPDQLEHTIVSYKILVGPAGLRPGKL